MRTANRKGHGHTGKNQHTGVDSTHDGVKVVTGVTEDLWVTHAQDGIGHKQAAEEEDFRSEEQPDAQLGAVKLLRHAVKVVSHMGIMTVGVVIMTVPLISVGGVGVCDGLTHMMLRGSSFGTTGNALVSAQPSCPARRDSLLDRWIRPLGNHRALDPSALR